MEGVEASCDRWQQPTPKSEATMFVPQHPTNEVLLALCSSITAKLVCDEVVGVALSAMLHHPAAFQSNRSPWSTSCLTTPLSGQRRRIAWSTSLMGQSEPYRSRLLSSMKGSS